MRTKTWALVALVGASTTALAQGGPPGGRRGGPPMARCAQTADSLTDAQKTQVKTLGDAFATAHKTQLDSLRAIMDQVRQARQSGASEDDVRAIMDKGKAINEALEPARKEFHQSVLKLLTQAQIDAGCIPPAPGGPPPGGRRGGRGGPPPA